MLKTGQTETVEITGYSAEGMGVCRIEGCVVFVPNAIRGERCRVKVTHVSANSAHGKIEEILERSSHRIPRACADAKLCGGCQYHHIDYAEELRAKAQKVTDALTRLGGVKLQAIRDENCEKAFPPEERRPEGPDEGCSIAGLVPITGADGLKRQNGEAETERVVGSDPQIAPAVAERVVGSDPQIAPVVAERVVGSDPQIAPAVAERVVGSDPQIAPVVAERVVGSDPQIAPAVAEGKAAAVPAPAASGEPSRQPDATVPEAVYAYRNKAQYPLAMKNGKPVAGFYKNRTHEVVPIKRCAILPEVFDRAKDVILRWAQEDRVSVYDEHTGKGLLRHIYLRRGAVSGQVMVCLVVNGRELPREHRLVNALRREIPGLASVQLSVNTKNTNVVLGSEFRTLWGRDFIEDQLCGFTFRLSARSFYQVNHDQAQRLYEKAVELAALHGTETVLDLYCGTGTITLALSRKAGKAVGVEVVPQAIEDAKENARRNGVENVEFYCADAGEAAKRFADAGTAPDVILVDPPRKGLEPEVIEAMAQMAPQRIVYVSCDPATLARDVKRLTEQGYTLTHAEAFDLFPRTFHVETVVQLVRKNPDMTVSVTLNLEDADLTASEAKATYDQIKAYVLETFGLRVTSLQIAQTKRKLGLPTGEHYNLSQKENQVIPNCPPEKESAIREALRHFRMV